MDTLARAITYLLINSAVKFAAGVVVGLIFLTFLFFAYPDVVPEDLAVAVAVPLALTYVGFRLGLASGLIGTDAPSVVVGNQVKPLNTGASIAVVFAIILFVIASALVLALPFYLALGMNWLLSGVVRIIIGSAILIALISCGFVFAAVLSAFWEYRNRIKLVLKARLGELLVGATPSALMRTWRHRHIGDS